MPKEIQSHVRGKTRSVGLILRTCVHNRCIARNFSYLTDNRIICYGFNSKTAVAVERSNRIEFRRPPSNIESTSEQDCRLAPADHDHSKIIPVKNLPQQIEAVIEHESSQDAEERLLAAFEMIFAKRVDESRESG